MQEEINFLISSHTSYVYPNSHFTTKNYWLKKVHVAQLGIEYGSSYAIAMFTPTFSNL